VGGEDHGRAALGEPGDELPEASALARVEADAGLVEQQHAGAGEQPDRDVDPLLVAAGETGDGLAAPLAQAGELEHLLGRGVRVLASLQAGEEEQVLLDGQPLVERRLLGHPADLSLFDLDLAAVRREDPGEDREQRRLARPVGPDHGHQLAGQRLEADPAQRLALAVELDQVPRS
jgi:hypothetical protein